MPRYQPGIGRGREANMKCRQHLQFGRLNESDVVMIDRILECKRARFAFRN